MKELTTLDLRVYTDHALLCLFGQKCQQDKLLEPFHELLKIKQKTVRHSPTDKLQDGLVSLMLGNQTLYETNTTLAADPALWYAFGRTACADQSQIQRTLAACNTENVVQLQKVNLVLLKKHGRALHHDYATGPLVIDIDLTGLPCSKHYEGATRGYFPNSKFGTTGRQLARATVSQYDEILYQQVFPLNTGSAQLEVFKQIVGAVWQALDLPAEQKEQVLLRLDGGYGTTEIIDYLLAEGYQFVVKLFSSSRATKLAKSLPEAQWHADTCHERDYSLLGVEANQPYQLTTAVPALVQIALRCKSQSKSHKKGDASPAKVEAKAAPARYRYSVLLIRRTGLVKDKGGSVSTQQGLAQLHFYDQRAGMEVTSFEADKQGLAIAKRRKRSLVGQEMLLGLAQLAHNLIIWLRGWLSQHSAQIRQYGLKRWVRDLFGLSGRITFRAGQIVKVRVSPHHELVRHYFKVLKHFFRPSGVRLILYKI
jgi:DDE family transposase